MLKLLTGYRAEPYLPTLALMQTHAPHMLLSRTPHWLLCSHFLDYAPHALSPLPLAMYVFPLFTVQFAGMGSTAAEHGQAHLILEGAKPLGHWTSIQVNNVTPLGHATKARPHRRPTARLETKEREERDPLKNKTKSPNPQINYLKLKTSGPCSKDSAAWASHCQKGRKRR